MSQIHRILKTKYYGPFPQNTETVILATGCFWGAEKSFWRLPGVYTTAVGYAAGDAASYPNPTYEQVCSGRTGYTEAVLVVWYKDRLTFADILRQFLQCHDPTQKNGQGNDRGTQYRGGIYYNSENQRRAALAAIESYSKSLSQKIATELKQETAFFYAENYHQQYLASPGARQYCSAMPRGVNLAPANMWLPKDLYEVYAPKLSEEYWKKHAPSPHCVLREPHEQIIWPEKAEDNKM